MTEIHLKLELHEHVAGRALEEIRSHPGVEVGGKFVGYVEGRLPEPRVVVVAYLDAGPGGHRTAVRHLSDTAYQFRLFQEVARDFPGLHFLGLWHSHPDGHGTLSQGDEHTGTVTVNNPGHEHDFLLSSLAVDAGGLRAGRHFVFLRGRPGYLEIDPGDVTVVRGPNPVADRIAEVAQRLHRTSRTPDPAPDLPPERTPVTWLETAAGKAVVVEDRGWLAEYPGLRPYLREGSMVWRGAIDLSGVTADCEYAYPADFAASAPVVDVRTVDGAHAVRYTLPSWERRESGFHFALARLSDLITSGRVTWEDDADTARTRRS
ncbi:hypothetical protein [Herbidospora sp. RD11066]